jgi:hypothetical protein
LSEEVKMAFVPIVFKKSDIDKWFGKNLELTVSEYKRIKKEKGDYNFGDLTEAALGGNLKAIKHLHAVLRKDYKSPWREILTSVVNAALASKPPIHIKWSFDPPGKRQSPKRIDVSYDQERNTFMVRLRGAFPSPWDIPT